MNKPYRIFNFCSRLIFQQNFVNEIQVVFGSKSIESVFAIENGRLQTIKFAYSTIFPFDRRGLN